MESARKVRFVVLIFAEARNCYCTDIALDVSISMALSLTALGGS